MKIKTIKIKNFRSYKTEVEIKFGDLTAFVGKNDIGKSTVLEALDIFFNDGKGVIKLDKDDVNKQALTTGDTETIISVCFEDVPTKIVIDSTNQTTLQDEFLLNSNNQLEIIKKYSNGGKESVFVKANHPTNSICKDLLQKKMALRATSFVKKHNHEEIIKLHIEGLSYKQIAEKLNIKSKGTISFIIKKSIEAKKWKQ